MAGLGHAAQPLAMRDAIAGEERGALQVAELLGTGAIRPIRSPPVGSTAWRAMNTN
jgi:hypothetical protein